MENRETDRWSRRGTWSVATVFALASLLSALAAWADDPAPAPAGSATAATDQATPAADAAKDANKESEEKPAISETITVTANKREENIREVPASVSVIDQDQMGDLAVKQLTDFANYVPGLNVTSSGTPGQTSITLRGIAPISSSATVATYVGEAPLGSSGLYQRATLSSTLGS